MTPRLSIFRRGHPEEGRKSRRRICHLLITAGPTRERIDPVRFISNYSTGTFGYTIAKEAVRKGFIVTLISGPTSLARPRGVRFISVESACQMRDKVFREFRKADCVIMAAAVSDWRPVNAKAFKIKKLNRAPNIRLAKNPDILTELSHRKKDKILVGFALETENLRQNALKKLRSKRLDLVVANKLSDYSGIFGDNLTSVLIIDKDGMVEEIKNRRKDIVAKIILDKILNLNIVNYRLLK